MFFLHRFFFKRSYITLHDSSINYVLLLIWSVFVMTTQRNVYISSEQIQLFFKALQESWSLNTCTPLMRLSQIIHEFISVLKRSCRISYGQQLHKFRQSHSFRLFGHVFRLQVYLHLFVACHHLDQYFSWLVILIPIDRIKQDLVLMLCTFPYAFSSHIQENDWHCKHVLYL